jgi:hypothetical protein
VWIGGSILTTWTACGAEHERVRIDVKQSDEAIRKKLLSYTPTGSDAAQVLDFVQLNLYWEGLFRSGVGVQSRPNISVYIGHVFKGPILYQAVEATWRFDEHRKLQEIKIKRSNQEGMYSSFQTPSSKPKVRIALGQSDEAIRMKLLKYTPIGSSLPDVTTFIGQRLYYEGGSVNGIIPLAGHWGPGIVLGGYVDSHDSLRKIVVVNWQFPNKGAQSKLDVIEVKRVSSLNDFHR